MTGARILVTGGGGFCGSAIAAALARSGHDVVATVRPGRRPVTPILGQVETVECDLTDPDAVADLLAWVRPDSCVHAAAAGARERCDDLELLVRTNVSATTSLVGMLADVGATRVVTLGSSSEYGSPAGAMTESSPPSPDDLYGLSKLAGGLAALAIGRARGLATTHLRLFSVYGPGEAAGRLVASLTRAIAERRPIALTGGRQVRDFVFIDDVVDATLHALVAPTPVVGTFNVGTGIETSVHELAQLACALAGGDVSLLRFGELPYRADERFSWRADTRLAAHQLGWKATTSLRAGLAQTLAALAADLRIAA
jgi:nucleoside-diphosphate-sugar epimerase